MGPKAPAPVPSYPDGAVGLEAMFRDVLTLAKADERERVHDYFKSLKMTPAELERLFGARAAELAAPYDEMMATLMHRGAVELVGVIYERKYDQVEVVPMTLPTPEDTTASPELRALARALIARPPLYSVRFKQAQKPQATRYEFFFYSDGRWRTGNFLGRVLAKRDAELTAAPTPR
jgi:hypothetical protein